MLVACEFNKDDNERALLDTTPVELKEDENSSLAELAGCEDALLEEAPVEVKEEDRAPLAEPADCEFTLLDATPVEVNEGEENDPRAELVGSELRIDDVEV